MMTLMLYSVTTFSNFILVKYMKKEPIIKDNTGFDRKLSNLILHTLPFWHS